MLVKKLLICLVIVTIFLIGCEEKVTAPKEDVTNPVITPNGGEFEDTVPVTITCETEGAVIRYTLDSSEPNEGSPIYTDSLEIETTTTVRARAFKENWNPSEITTANFTITRTVAAPVFAPSAGTYYGSFELEMITATEDANIHFTTDNREPHIGSQLYTEPIAIDRTMTIRARAYKQGWSPSRIVSADYSMALPALSFYPPPEVYYEPIIVSIDFDPSDILEGERIEGAEIYYTTNGTEPTVNSRLYTEPFRIERSLTIKARAFKEEWASTEIKTGYYDLDLPLVVNPVFEPFAGTYFGQVQVSISSVIPDTQIYYTTNGSDPNQTSTPYTQPIEISTSTTIKARAYKQDWYPSEVVTAEYYISDLNIELINVSGGTFRMGDTQSIGDFDESPVHNVTLSDFLIGRYPVRISEWELVMESSPAEFTGANRPIENVSWFDAVKFCNRLSIMSNLTPVYSVFGSTNPSDWEENFSPVIDWDADGYRLPTEAEWEYAARAGTNDPDHRYSGSQLIDDVGWYDGNSGGRSVPVGLKDSNQLNINDMSGNVWEWCWDWYSSSYYSASTGNDPKGPEEGTVRVRRGGSWSSPSASCRISNRSAVFPTAKDNNIGFRVLRRN